MWNLARRLKALPHLADALADDLEPLLRDWHRLAVPVIRTIDFDTSMSDFRRMWELVRYPAGGNFAGVVTEALAGPPPPEAGLFDDRPSKNLIAILSALQRHAGPCGCFFLSARKAEAVAGFTNQMTPSRRLLALQKRDPPLLEVVTPGTKRTAARYRWLGSTGFGHHG